MSGDGAGTPPESVVTQRIALMRPQNDAEATAAELAARGLGFRPRRGAEL